MEVEPAQPLALVLAHFRKDKSLFPVLTALRTRAVYGVATGMFPVSAIDRLPHGDGQTVRKVCKHFGLDLPA